MRNWYRQINQAGDTIVEVLIATAVVSSVLAGAFLVSQKSSLAVRDSQEHSEMSQVLQGQVELVRSLALSATDNTSGIFAHPPGGTKYFCVDGSNPANPVRVDFPSGFNLPAPDADTYASYPPKCSNIQSRYNVAVTYDPSSQVFTFTGRWDRLSGGKNQEQLSYRIYPGSPVAAAGSIIAPLGVIGGVAGICGSDPTDPACTPLTGNAGIGVTPTGQDACLGVYPYPDPHCWNKTIFNKSSNPGKTVTGCTWDYADGTVENLPASSPKCIENMSFKHQFPVKPLSSPDSQIAYNVVLTMRFAGGVSPASNTYTINIPYHTIN
jgi:type II secretory pathway pseudopilin PulG